MNAEEYKNLVLLKENLSKLKHSTLISDVSFRKLFGVMKDHCDCVRLSGPPPRRRRPASANTNEPVLGPSLTSIFVLLSHMMVEVSCSREKKKLQQIQLWFANQLPGLFETLREPKIVIPSSIQKHTISADLLRKEDSPTEAAKPKPLFEEQNTMNDRKPTLVTRTPTNRISISAPIPEMLLPKRRPMSASASMAYLDNVMKRVFPDEEVLGQLQFASRRGMPFAHRYTAHSGGERPEKDLLNGIRQLVVENAVEEAADELETLDDDDITPRCQSAIDPSLVDRVAADLEQRRERIAATPSRGFRQPVVDIEPNSSIVSIPPMLATSTAPPSSPRGHHESLDPRRTGPLLLTPRSSSRPRSGYQDDDILQSAQTPYGSGHEIINVRSTPVPPPSLTPFDGMMSTSPVKIADNTGKTPLKPVRVGSAPPVISSRTPIHSSSTAARMSKQRREFHQASRESAGFQPQQQPNPENDLKDVLRVKFLLRSKSRSSHYRFSMRDHFRMLRQLSAQSQRSAIGAPPTTPTYFSFCASASSRKPGDDEETDDFDLYNTGRTSAPPNRRQYLTPNSYGTDILALVGQVDSAMEFSRTLQKELEKINREAELAEAEAEKRPDKLAKNVATIGPSIPMFRANLVHNPEAIFEAAERKRQAAVLIQRVYRGFRVRRQVANMNSLIEQISSIMKGLVPEPTEPSRWQSEAKTYRRIMERIVIRRLETIHRNNGEKYPRRINRPSIAFTLEAFTNYLETKLMVATEFRRRAIGGTVSQAELLLAFKALSVPIKQQDLEIALTERFGMRYRYKTRQMPLDDFIDLYWCLRAPSGTPPPPKPAPPPSPEVPGSSPMPPDIPPEEVSKKPSEDETGDTNVVLKQDGDDNQPSSTFVTQQEVKTVLLLPPPAYAKFADHSNDASLETKQAAKPTTEEIRDFTYKPPSQLLRPATSSRVNSAAKRNRSPKRPRTAANTRRASSPVNNNNKR